LLGRYAVSSHFFADAGFQVDLLNKEKDVFKVNYNGNDLQYTQKLEDKFTLLNMQVAADLFYKFKPDRVSMGVGLRYLHGLTDIDKPAAGTQVNNSWQLNVTIPIGAAAKEKKGK